MTHDGTDVVYAGGLAMFQLTARSITGKKEWENVKQQQLCLKMS